MDENWNFIEPCWVKLDRVDLNKQEIQKRF